MDGFKVSGQGEVRIGRNTGVGAAAEVVFLKPGTVAIGDYCSIGDGVRIVCSGGDVAIGDWTTVHAHGLVLCGQGVAIGPHCWFGQNCIVDGTGGIRIGRGVRVGMYSQLWSHVAAGEQIEGCTLIGERPVVIEDDVWLVGSCIVASGVTVGERTIALIGSNITKSWPGRLVLAGSPATSKPGLSFYRALTLDEKWQLLLGWLDDEDARQRFRVESRQDSCVWVCCPSDPSANRLAFVRDAGAAAALRTVDADATVCCIEDKSYNKRVNATEHVVLKYLAGNKARFYEPVERVAAVMEGARHD